LILPYTVFFIVTNATGKQQCCLLGETIRNVFCSGGVQEWNRFLGRMLGRGAGRLSGAILHQLGNNRPAGKSGRIDGSKFFHQVGAMHLYGF